MKHPDVIVIGLGAMGSAACCHLAQRGFSVLGLDQFDLCHDKGSSHGRTRVIRKAYFEDPRYVPLLEETFVRWRELEHATGESLLTIAGCLNVGPRDHAAILGVRESAERHGLAHEWLDAAEIHRRWPGLSPNEGDVGVYEPEAGFLAPERCITAHVRRAASLGARIETNCRVTDWRADHNSVHIETDRAVFTGKRLILTAGPWMPKLLGSTFAPPLSVERQVQAWFEPKDAALFQVGRFPVFIHFVEDRAYYGIPAYGSALFKVARHHGGAITTADDVKRRITDTDVEDIRRYLRRCLPPADGPLVEAKVCLYTNTPDENFIIDRHGRHDNVLIAGGFSGHGFKFAPVVGRMLADMVQGDVPTIDMFRADRFPGKQSA